ncbi:DUF4914 family protein [Clostridium oryzae]|uniref:DUF4914 domain-containing protein n=1 Tax=Clostridium oryzae TaxID=1450648 RepID=A0A1V4INC1_9CLOT|nr:DUF4914 family protein [Clostridium oryzae]OPJ61300.1 hypothetical protein CLORY_23400 [Clostridium oryzae]
MEKSIFKKLILPEQLGAILENKEVILAETREDLLDIAMGRDKVNIFDVSYDTPGKGNVLEATVVRCKNGLSVNYTDPYMRRRDPDCTVIADDKPTDKPQFKDRFNKDFNELRNETFDWFNNQDELILLPFMAGADEIGYPALLVAPANAGFFASCLADLQGFIPRSKIPYEFKPRAILYLAPPFRHTYFGGKQVVVHNRLEKMHELFCYNLYPGPSAKKGIYGVLLNIGEEEGWVTLHASAVKITTPYENTFTIMHEGASGGGKSEMTEQFHRELDGRLLIGTNTLSGEKFYMDIKEACELQPVTDDMAMAIPSIQNGKKLVVEDAENGWFLRIDHINKYGTDPNIERMTIYPKEPLIFLNIDGKPEATCLIWEHTLDAPGKPCTNPRVILPRTFIENVAVNEPVEIDLRSFGVRTPPSERNNPNYGIIGIFHVLPPALAWLWRLVAPRGHANPSVTSTEGMSSEGVGSYWPFATGRRVDQANLLLKQILSTPETHYVLIPNQHIGVYKVGFMGQWIAREYLARRGNVHFKKEPLVPSRCPLLGYALESLKIDGQSVPKDFLQVDLQDDNGVEGYDAGAEMLNEFFKSELQQFLTPDLDPLGKQIIEVCLRNGSLKEYVDLIP